MSFMPDQSLSVTNQIEVVYISAERQVIKTLDVPEGTNAVEAIQLSGIRDEFPEIDLDTQKIGVYGRFVDKDSVLKAGDRVEIYRPLLIDPKEARRRRALKEKALKESALKETSTRKRRYQKEKYRKEKIENKAL